MLFRSYTLSDLALKELGVIESVACNTPLPSTVIKWTGDGWMILRQGAIVFSDLEKHTYRIQN